jgi:hypothetical protein
MASESPYRQDGRIAMPLLRNRLGGCQLVNTLA